MSHDRFRVSQLVAWATLVGVACSGQIGGDPSGSGGRPSTADAPSAPPNPNLGDNPVAAMKCPKVLPDPGQAIARRLTHDELSNTLVDTLGLSEATLAPVIDKLPSIKSGSFANDRDGLVVVDPELVKGYRELANKVATSLPETFAAGFASCQDFTSACQGELVHKLAAVLFRRPLPDDRVARYASLFTVAKEEGDTFAAGAALVLRAMLQAPSFLYRLESSGGDLVDIDPSSGGGKARAVDGHEMAARLSYWLWASAPDRELLSAAAAGQLGRDDGIRAQVTRMLDDPRARRTLAALARGWLHLGDLASVMRDKTRYPDFSAELLADMNAETMTSFTDAWNEGTPFGALFQARHTTLSPRLARVYGLTPSGDAPSRHDLTGVPTRAGLLTQASVLAVSGERDEPSMIMRGLYLFNGLLCKSVSAPPPDVDATPVKPAAQGRTQRAAAEDRAANPRCRACHGAFDPLAFAFEPYDGLGRFRSKDEFGNPLASAGTLNKSVAGADTAFADVREFMSAFSRLPDMHTCFAQKAATFALGEPIESDRACLFQGVVKAVNAGDGSLEDVVRAVALMPAMRHRRVD